MIRLSSLTPSDILELDRLWKLYWSTHTLPSPQESIVNAIAKNDEGRIIAYGTVHHFAEAMLFVDPSARRRDRAQAVRSLMLEAFRGTEKAGLKDIYSFISDPDFALLIERHFKFDRIAEPGELLVKKLE